MMMARRQRWTEVGVELVATRRVRAAEPTPWISREPVHAVTGPQPGCFFGRRILLGEKVA
jgi:hypothetical protein